MITSAAPLRLVDAEPIPLADLLAQAHAGDTAAFEELYTRTCSRIYGMAVRVLRSPDLAAEVTQEVYVEVWQQADRYRPERGGVLAWMVTITHRRAVDRVRSVSAATTRDQRWGELSVPVAFDEVWEQTERAFDDDRVRSALSSLTDLQREVVVAVYFGGTTPTQLAATLGLPVGTVKTRLRNGLIRMRGVLEAQAA